MNLPAWKPKTIAGIYFRNHREARLMQEILHREMRERAGKPDEAILAGWNNELAHIRKNAEKQDWGGWE